MPRRFVVLFSVLRHTLIRGTVSLLPSVVVVTKFRRKTDCFTMAAVLRVLVFAALSFLLCFCREVAGEDTSLKNFTLEILDRDQISEPGSDVSFTCQLSVGMEVLTQYRVSWLHRPRGGDGQPLRLTENGGLVHNSTDRYSAAHTELPPDQISFILKIKNVAEADDGQYICRAERISNYETYAEKTGTLTVSQAQKLVQLVIDGKDPITGVRTSPVSLTAGAHPVRCVASGFSPASDYRLHLYRNNEELESVDGSNRLQKNMNLIEQDSGQTLRCVVKHGTDSTAEAEASAPIIVTAEGVTDHHGDDGDDNHGDDGDDNHGHGHGGEDTDTAGDAASTERPRLLSLLATFTLIICALL